MVSVKHPLVWFIPLAVALILSGCSFGSSEPDATGEPTPNTVRPGAPGQGTRTVTPEELEDARSAEYTEADVQFMQGMIQHHAQALRMADLAPSRSTRRQIELLAQRIDLSQQAEIELIRNWLKARNEAAPELHRVHGHAHGAGLGRRMPGMLTEAQLKQLATAEGAVFDRLFLQGMIRHHQGAVKMVSDLYAGGSGFELEIDAFARNVDADQQIEIGRMQELLARLRADGGRQQSAG